MAASSPSICLPHFAQSLKAADDEEDESRRATFHLSGEVQCVLALEAADADSALGCLSKGKK